MREEWKLFILPSEINKNSSKIAYFLPYLQKGVGFFVALPLKTEFKKRYDYMNINDIQLNSVHWINSDLTCDYIHY